MRFSLNSKIAVICVHMRPVASGASALKAKLWTSSAVPGKMVLQGEKKASVA